MAHASVLQALAIGFCSLSVALLDGRCALRFTQPSIQTMALARGYRCKKLSRVLGADAASRERQLQASTYGHLTKRYTASQRLKYHALSYIIHCQLFLNLFTYLVSTFHDLLFTTLALFGGWISPFSDSLFIIPLSCLVQTHGHSLSRTFAFLSDHCIHGYCYYYRQLSLGTNFALCYSIHIVQRHHLYQAIVFFLFHCLRCKPHCEKYPPLFFHRHPAPTKRLPLPAISNSSSRINSNNSHTNSFRIKLDPNQIKPQQGTRKSKQTCIQSTTSLPLRPSLFSPAQPRGTWSWPRLHHTEVPTILPW